jgi:predicted regulator of amino acid metabolism with ACT domain
MWARIESAVQGFPERLIVLKSLLENGLAIRNGKLYLGKIEIPTLKLARSLGLDRRTVKETVKMIDADPELGKLFSGLQPAGVSLRGVAKQLGLGVAEILVDDSSQPGILAGASTILSKAGISIRQALVDDPELVPDPKLVLIGEKPLPGNIIPELLKLPGVAKVSIS